MPTSASLNPKTADIFHRELRDFPSVDTALEERMPSILSILTLSLLNPDISYGKISSLLVGWSIVRQAQVNHQLLQLPSLWWADT